MASSLNIAIYLLIIYYNVVEVSCSRLDFIQTQLCCFRMFAIAVILSFPLLDIHCRLNLVRLYKLLCIISFFDMCFTVTGVYTVYACTELCICVTYAAFKERLSLLSIT